MVKHTVIWKLKEENKAENALKIKALLTDLTSKIEVIKNLEAGINENGGEYDVILISDFESYDDLKTYDIHPEHIKVKEFIVNAAKNRIAVDYVY